MSGAPKGGGEDHAYFRQIEELFVRLRGSPLLLSPEDWRIASSWRREGIPLELIESTLRELFSRRRERGATGRVQSLKYCAPAVESAWRERRRLTAAAAAGEARPFESAERLARLAAALPGAFAALAPRIRAIDGSPEAMESALATLDRELLRDAAAGLSASERNELEREVDRRLARFAAGLPAAEVAESRARLFETALRERQGLPVLSLFSPDASP